MDSMDKLILVLGVVGIVALTVMIIVCTYIDAVYP